jgi:hypothetical protein
MKSSNVFIPKGTYLRHCVTPKNVNRSYRWYYMTEQTGIFWKYTPSDDRQDYITNKDIYATSYGMSVLYNRYTNQVESSAGAYSSYEYEFRDGIVHYPISKESIIDLLPCIRIGGNDATNNPLTHQVIEFGDEGDLDKTYTDVIEVILSNDDVDRIETI